MKMFRIEGLRWAIFLFATLLMPCGARAGLLGDTVGATLTNLSGGQNAFNTTAVVGGGVEFQGDFTGAFQSHWTLDISDNGISLVGSNCVIDPSCNFSSGIRLFLSSLDFTPPATLTGLTMTSGDLVISGTPVVTASSITITFQAFSLDTMGGSGDQSKNFVTDFVTTPVAATPEPATVFLVVLGALGLGILGLRRVLN